MVAVKKRAGWQNGLVRLLTTDFCPWANRCVYWLKEPVGWFVLAMLAAVLVGLYVSPIGWTIASALGLLITAGMLWPLLAVWGTSCRLFPAESRGTEEQECELVVSVRNRLPLPVWGLAVEGYLDRPTDETELTPPTVALACVPPLATADYVLSIEPPLRGHYPRQLPQAVCSFPFGIWTARRPLRDVEPLIVWPRRYRILGRFHRAGRLADAVGEGLRDGRHGDFVGVRPFRRGDSTKQIHWVTSARTESLVVTERAGPQRPELRMWVDTAGRDPVELTRRIRVAASLLEHFQQARISVRLRLGDRDLQIGARGATRGTHWLDALAAVPLRGQACRRAAGGKDGATIGVTGGGAGAVRIYWRDGAPTARRAERISEREIAPREDLAERMATLWKELSDATAIA
jgi:uncharacterized protein (DUF58 family)